MRRRRAWAMQALSQRGRRFYFPAPATPKQVLPLAARSLQQPGRKRAGRLHLTLLLQQLNLALGVRLLQLL